VDKETTSIAERILRSGRRISGMVDEILDFARGRLGGGITPDMREAMDLEADLRHVVADSQGADPHRLIRCTFDLHDQVACDPDRLAQLLSNLLTNALKHGAPDEPAAVTARSRHGAFVLSVTNQGSPIPAESIVARMERSEIRGLCQWTLLFIRGEGGDACLVSYIRINVPLQIAPAKVIHFAFLLVGSCLSIG
jgi:signal transduction histidine kinase